MKKTIIKITALAIMLVLTISVAGCRFFSFENGSIEDLPHSTEKLGNVVYGTIDGERTPKDKTEVIESARKSVVAIAIDNGDGTISYGSGVIADIDVEGDKALASNEFYILTCHHVLRGMGTINVFLPDAEGDNYGESDYNKNDYSFAGVIGPNIYDYPLTLVGGDSVSDIAVLKLNIGKSNITVTPAKFPVSTYSYKVGEDVVAIGNPAGYLPGTVSVGTISYINREIKTDVGEMTLLQLNVDTYHGSSGGALFNIYGELIGITNAGNDLYPGINYAIPFVVDINNGTKDNGFLNISGQLIASATETNYGYITGRVGLFGFSSSQQNANSNSVVIVSVTHGSIAEKAGLMANDIILKVKKNATSLDDLKNSKNIVSNAQVTEVFNSLVIGDKVSLLVERGTVFNRTTQMVTMTAIQSIFCDTGYYPTVD
jgi:S1-C subfamily serine protease